MDTTIRRLEMIETFNYRHATKEFDPEKKISEEDFRFILEAGRLSPSSGGNEPWKFLIVQSTEFRSELAPHAYGAARQLPSSSHFVLILARKGLTFDSPYMIEHQTQILQMPLEIFSGMGEAYKKFYNDLHLDSERALLDWSSKQTYIALGNMMTAAAHIGVDSCAIEGFELDAVNDLLQKRGLLGEDEFSLSVMVAFGYRIRQGRHKKRRPMEDIALFV
ncbi:NAD(P)H-dependent oxidoreductase [Paenibacillus agricola]|uniref:NAD(P)H-dependent oxidoreductase n=1 Tax=Paenibacillus agricola TaxID=2716264 RepID=A0ABX0JBT2_9BACL|nr:NAD(P)H-dependent oxidoreductase [Paenibacillus agricola]NHN32830.1 NAD(P)H-dependent oxidoreductase [Paenibacillus agricola]